MDDLDRLPTDLHKIRRNPVTGKSDEALYADSMRTRLQQKLKRAKGQIGSDGGFVVETRGLEPPTPCLQSRCSSRLSYVPWPTTG